MKNKGENEENGSPPNCRQSSQTPEYVKRTAKLFESVNVSEEIEIKNGLEKRTILESFTLAQGEPKEKSDDSADVLDGESNKKPSYLGVSCSNSGYRNVINYDSKLREGFHSAHSQRESLVLCSSRLRENSPLRRDVEFKFRNGAGPNGDTIKVNANEHFEREQIVPVNGVSQMKKFVNISTSTKTISTFRNSKDVKINELEDNFRHDKNNECNSNGEPNLISKPILNGKNESGQGRRGYSGLGPDFSPKILKSPEKNCNSFLKSISSFENNCKKSQPAKNPSYSRGEQTICDTATSIQQRIERLYGPGALAQGFRMQKSNSKTKILDKHTGEDSSEG